MKEFDLKKALAGEAVITRDGRRVTQITHFNVEEDCHLRGVLNNHLYSWTDEGSYCADGTEDSKDLFMAPTTKQVALTPNDLPPVFWVNLGLGYAYWSLVVQINSEGVQMYNGCAFTKVSFIRLMEMGAEYSEDRITRRKFWKAVEE